MRSWKLAGWMLGSLLVLSIREGWCETADGGVESTNVAVRFRDRVIDLRPYYEGFPYAGFRAIYDANVLLYFRDTQRGRELLTLPLDRPTLHLDQGIRLGTVDWSARGLREVMYHSPSGQYVVLADDANEERFNLFLMSPETGELRRLTDRPYVYGYGLDKQYRLIGYLPRYRTGQVFRSCLNLYELGTGRDREVVCDSPEMMFTWSLVNFRPDGRGVVFVANREGDRNRQNLVYMDLSVPVPQVRILTDSGVLRRHVDTLREWLDGDRFVYSSDESGYTNLYLFDLEAGRSRPVTQFREDVSDMAAFRVGERFLVGAMVKRPYESELFVVDPRTGETLARRVFDATAVFLDYTANRAMVRTESRRTLFTLEEVRVDAVGQGRFAVTVSRRAGVPPTVARQIEQCDVERVSIPTFDVDARTGRTRLLHGYLQTPRNPPRDPSRRFALVEAFYGGENEFDVRAQIFCAAGGMVLSPAIRGSAGFGAEFAALNDHDLGGNEVFDLIYSGRYLVRRFGLRERQIGLFGASHGGYEVMRAVTFPPEVNGRRESFQWGFGLSWFGFSNIVTFFERCNIPDWVLLEAGDPRTEREKLLDRSPVTHAARAVAPLLLLHGENDNRVPVEESRQMAAALRAAGKRVTYVEFPGQGHGLKGLANQYRVWTAVFAFLSREMDPVLVQNAPRRVAKRHISGVWWAGGTVGLVLLLSLAGWIAWQRDRW